MGLIFIDFGEFLRYVRIQEPGELSLEFQFWPHLVDFVRHLRTYNLIDVLKSKQVGISWILAAYALWKIYTCQGWNTLEISKGKDAAVELLGKSKVIYDNLPAWMRVYTVYPLSETQFGFKEMRSVITAYPSTETSGVGETAGLVIHDESDFHEFFKVNLGHTRATVADSPERQLITVSTVDKTLPGSYFKEHWKASNNGEIDRLIPGIGSNGFKALFYPYDVRPGRDEKWYQAIERENKDEPWKTKGNYPRTIREALEPLAAVSCFKADVLTRLWEESGYGEVREGFIHILQPPVVGVQYAAGIDVGEGVGLDYSALTIIGKKGLSAEVVAVIYSNQVGTDSFAFECNKLCREYHSPLLVVDNIGIGRAVIDKLVELGYPKLYKMNENKHGWALTRPNKRELVVKTVERVNNGTLVTRFKPQVKEMMEYQWVNGYPEPMGKTHGDLVISLMLAGAVLDKIGAVVEASMYIKGRRVW